VVARHLPHHERLAVARITPAVARALEGPALHASHLVTHLAGGVETLDRFLDLLHGGRSLDEREPPVQALPDAVRGDPLAALGAQIPRLPVADQPAAIDAFLAAAQTLPAPRSALVEALIQAAVNGPQALRDRSNLAWHAARQEVQQGANIHDAVQRLGVAAGPQEIEHLNNMAWDCVKAAVLAGTEDLAAALQTHGITNRLVIATARHDAAVQAVFRGEDLDATISRYGLSQESEIWYVRLMHIAQHARSSSQAGPSGDAPT
jgi:hypothetical protein